MPIIIESSFFFNKTCNLKNKLILNDEHKKIMINKQVLRIVFASVIKIKLKIDDL